jgi:hypothetical protein
MGNQSSAAQIEKTAFSKEGRAGFRKPWQGRKALKFAGTLSDVHR